MRKRFRTFWAGLVLAGAASIAPAGEGGFDETRTAIDGQAPPAASIDELSWLAGSWVGEGLGGRAREVYSPPMGGVITGHFVFQRGDAMGFSEILSIAPLGDSLVYRLKHFHPDLTGWEEKDEVIEFPLVAKEGDAFYFDGLTIRKDGEDGMVAAVRIDRGDAGVSEAVFRYRRENGRPPTVADR
ncbi:DUF6265 family protein [Halomonas denitrificans]|nr:hypothetical protein [Halomonas denitrificans]